MSDSPETPSKSVPGDYLMPRRVEFKSAPAALSDESMRLLIPVYSTGIRSLGLGARDYTPPEIPSWRNAPLIKSTVTLTTEAPPEEVEIIAYPEVSDIDAPPVLNAATRVQCAFDSTECSLLKEGREILLQLPSLPESHKNLVIQATWLVDTGQPTGTELSISWLGRR